MASGPISRNIQPQFEQIFTERKANTTTDWFASDGTFTVTNRSLVFVTASYLSAPIKGLAVGISTAPNIYSTAILIENTTSASAQAITVLSPGTYRIWAKLGSTGSGSPITVYKICDILD